MFLHFLVKVATYLRNYAFLRFFLFTPTNKRISVFFMDMILVAVLLLMYKSRWKCAIFSSSGRHTNLHSPGGIPWRTTRLCLQHYYYHHHCITHVVISCEAATRREMQQGSKHRRDSFFPFLPKIFIYPSCWW